MRRAWEGFTRPKGPSPRSEQPGRDWVAKRSAFDTGKSPMYCGRDEPGLTSIYNPAMATKPKVKPKARPKGPWTPEEIARNERANKAQVKRDRARGVSTNLEEVVALKGK